MQYTTNYGLTKLELSDSPADITEINSNWNTIDEKLKEHADILDGTTGAIAFTNKENSFTKNQTFDANLQFTNHLIYSSITKLGLVPKGEVAEQNKYLQLRLLDSENLNQITHTLAEMVMTVNVEGDTSSSIRAYKNETDSSENADILVGYDKSRNRFYTKCLSPDANSNTTEIATTEWCHDNLVDTTSIQHINADKYFHNLGLQRGVIRCDSDKAIKGTENTADYLKIALVQKDGQWNYSSTIGGFEVSYSNDKSVKTRIYASAGVNANDNRNSEISINCDADGNFFGLAPTPKDSSDTNEIATTEWVRERIPELAPEPDLSDYVKSVNGVTPDPETGNVKIEIPDFVPSGTKMLFYQAAAPTGWTKLTGVGNRAVKIVEDATGGTVGGTVNFSDVFKNLTSSSTTVTISGTTGGRAITIAQLAKHSHTLSIFGEQGSNGTNYTGHTTKSTDSTGSDQTHNHTFSGSQAHTHTVNIAVKYTNVIICKKD